MLNPIISHPSTGGTQKPTVDKNLSGSCMGWTYQTQSIITGPNVLNSLPWESQVKTNSWIH